MHIDFKHLKIKRFLTLALAGAALLTACADAEGPKARDVNIPAPLNATARGKAINERPDPVQYLPLGDDVLLPESEGGQTLPSTVVGPFELRNETLAGALQLILDGTEIPVSFETGRSLDNNITVTNLKGPINEVVQQICGIADLYCSYERGILNVKDTQIFTVSIPPIAAADQVGQLMTNVSGAIAEITGSTPIVDASTRTIVYRATERTSEIARRYFQRLRMNTALIVFESYIWEVSLNAGNSTGINWDYFDNIGKFNLGVNLVGEPLADLGTPVSIGLPTTGAVDLATGDVLRFISNYGAVKTISQPQITVLAGSEARLRVADTQNYLASVSRTTTDGGLTTTSTTTDSVDSGFTLVIGSNWDNATVYGNINILLQEVRSIDTFPASADSSIQLPTTSERELQTQVRVRPGDSLLIAGLVRERDNLDSQGPGLNEPIIPTSRTVQTDNVELVFLLKPRVIVFTQEKPTLPAQFPVTALKKDPATALPPAVMEPAVIEPVIMESALPPSPPKPAPVKSRVPDKVIAKEVAPPPPAVKAPVRITPDEAPKAPAPVPVEKPFVKSEASIPDAAMIEPAAGSGDTAMEQERAMRPTARRISSTSPAAADAPAKAEKISLPTVRRIAAPAPGSVEKVSLPERETHSDENGDI